MPSLDSLNCRRELKVGDATYHYFSLPEAAQRLGNIDRLPKSLKVLLENLLRNEDGQTVQPPDLQAMVDWLDQRTSDREIQYRPARVLMQDFTGVPAVVDLAAMRDAMAKAGGDPQRINPLSPVDLVIDHSVMVDSYASSSAFHDNVELEMQRNGERYAFLRWGQHAFDNFSVVPPGTGICHQVNLEYLARTVWTKEEDGVTLAYPDTLVGTDSHTTMINGLGVLGWGVGGIEAEAAMLGQPVSMLIPEVIGFKLSGKLKEGITATDLVLTVTQMLRKKGVVGKFVEFYGDGLADLPLADRATIANMAPEYGATCGFFPVDEITLGYLRLSGRPEATVQLVEAYSKAQGLWREPGDEPLFSGSLSLDMGSVEASLAGPKRPQDRVPLGQVSQAFDDFLGLQLKPSAKEEGRLLSEGGGTAVGGNKQSGEIDYEDDGHTHRLKDGAVVIAAITSCTNTSNPSVMMAAGLLAKKAVEKGLQRQPWVKSSLAPGSKVVTEYFNAAGLTPYLEKLGFNLVGYGCTTCIGNSGPLPEAISAGVNASDLAVVSVLSGNRNFEGRINPDVKMNYLASPPLVVAYAIAGTMDANITTDPLGIDPAGEPVYLRDIWPSPAEVQATVDECIDADMFTSRYADLFAGDEAWQSLPTPTGDTFAWDSASTYVRKPPYFDGMGVAPAPVTDVVGARVLARLGNSVTTDHISPAGSIKPDSPAGRYLADNGVARRDFNSYGSRRGNHEVMIRGTFANIRLRNQLLDGVEGGFTRDFTAPDAPQTTIYDAAQSYAAAGVPLVVLAGTEYGSGSSRDWAAKGTALLGVRAVIAESYERIHRSNLIGMGVLPLQYPAGQTAESLGLDGSETFSISGVTALNEGTTPRTVAVRAVKADDTVVAFDAVLRIDTPGEADYYRNGGILQFVLRSLL